MKQIAKQGWASLLAFGLLTGCSLFGLNDVKPDSAQRHIIWQMRWPEGQLTSMAPFEYGDYLFFSDRNDQTYLSSIYWADKRTGELRGQWNESTGAALDFAEMHRYKNLLVFVSDRMERITAFNLDTKRTEWKIPVRSGSYHLRGLKDKLLVATEGNFEVIDLDNPFGLRQYVAVAEQLNEVFGAFVLPEWYLNARGDAMLLLLGFPQRTPTALSYHFGSRTVTHRLPLNQTAVGGNGATRLARYKDRLLFQDIDRLDCRDTLGNLVWTFPFRGNSVGSPFFIEEGRLFVKGCSTDALYALDPDTGKMLWQLPDETIDTGSGQRFFYQNGVIYLAQGELYAVDARTGTVLWGQEGRYNQSTFYGQIGGTGNSKRLYAAAGTYLKCFEAVR